MHGVVLCQTKDKKTGVANTNYPGFKILEQDLYINIYINLLMENYQKLMRKSWITYSITSKIKQNNSELFF